MEGTKNLHEQLDEYESAVKHLAHVAHSHDEYDDQVRRIKVLRIKLVDHIQMMIEQAVKVDRGRRG